MSDNTEGATGIDRYELVPHVDGQWHVRMVADNGQTIFWSEAYRDKRDAKHAISLVRRATHDGERVLLTGYNEIVPIVEVES